MPKGIFERHPRPLAERFWAKVRTVDDLWSCWEWTGAIDGFTGYGVFQRGRGIGTESTHRMAWALTNGPVPDGMWILHSCDNRPCVRPDHLFVGTAADNSRDSHDKGWPNGRPGPVRRLTPDDVATIRRLAAEGINPTSIAARIGTVSRSAIKAILSGRIYVAD